MGRMKSSQIKQQKAMDMRHLTAHGEENRLRAEHRKLVENMEREAATVEEILELKGIALEGTWRTAVLSYIGGLWDVIDEKCRIAEDALEALSRARGSLEQAVQEKKDAEEQHEREKQELLQLVGHKAELADSLNAVLEKQEAERKARAEKRAEKKKGSRTIEEQLEKVKKDEAAAERKLRKLQKKKEELEEFKSDIVETATAEKVMAGLESEDTTGAAADTQDPAAPGNAQSTVGSSQAGTDSVPTGADSENKTSGAEEPSGNREQTPEDLEKERDVLRGAREYADFRINQNFMDSNTPSSQRTYRDPKTTTKNYSKAGASSDTTSGTESNAPEGESGSSGGTTTVTPEEIAAMEEELRSRTAALHDPNKSPFVEPTSGKKGKPVGSKGGGRTELKRIDERRTVVCTPSKCAECERGPECMAFQKAKQKAQSDPDPHGPSVYDLVITTRKDTYVAPKIRCPIEGKVLRGDFPEEVRTTASQFGPTIRTLCICLNTQGMMGYRNIAETIGALMDDDKLSAGTIENWVKDVAEKLKPTTELIMAGASLEAYMHSDETGVRVKGVLHWVHAACTNDYIYIRVHRRRGRIAMNEIGLLPFYEGVLVSDCWKSYFGYTMDHCLCNAHLLRELYALTKYFSKDKVWAQEAMDLLREMDRERDKLKKQGIDHFEQDVLDAYLKKYDDIVKKGLAIHPDAKYERKNASKGKARCVLDRMHDYKDWFLRFMVDFNAPFTNNYAERNIRFFAGKRKVVGSFDTLKGADDFALILSYILTAKRRNITPYAAIREAVYGRATELLFTPEDVEALTKRAEDLKKRKVDLLDKEMKAAEAAYREKVSKVETKLANAERLKGAAQDKLEAARKNLEDKDTALAAANNNLVAAFERWEEATGLSAIGVLSGRKCHNRNGTPASPEEQEKAVDAVEKAVKEFRQLREAHRKANDKLASAQSTLDKKQRSVEKASAELEKLRKAFIETPEDPDETKDDDFCTPVDKAI